MSPHSTVRSTVLVSRRSLGIALAAFLVTAASPVRSDPSFPGRPVTLVLLQPPGGGTDLIGRQLAEGLREIWGHPVIVENKPSAGGIVGTESVVQAKPTGHTLLLATDAGMVTAPFLFARLPYNPLTDLTPIGLVGFIPMILVANPSLKVKTLGEFVTLAKSSTRQLDYASSGVGITHHMSMESLMQATGIKLNHVPYKGGAPALNDVLAGHVPVMWTGLSSALPHMQTGKLVPLAFGSPERSPLAPSVPTVAELGYPGFEVGTWLGVMGPAGMPQSLVQKINADIQTVLRSSRYLERVLGSGNEVRSGSSAEFQQRIEREYNRNRALFATMNIERR
jgi:tripartite-type tricarboxylate transporter receptor subunit TctC